MLVSSVSPLCLHLSHFPAGSEEDEFSSKALWSSLHQEPAGQQTDQHTERSINEIKWIKIYIFFHFTSFVQKCTKSLQCYKMTTFLHIYNCVSTICHSLILTSCCVSFYCWACKRKPLSPTETPQRHLGLYWTQVLMFQGDVQPQLFRNLRKLLDLTFFYFN